MRIAPIPPENVVFKGDLPRARLANFDAPFGNYFKLVFMASHQSAVRSRRMVNSMAPSGSSRHRSTSLI
jgi:hypothetical protein